MLGLMKTNTISCVVGFWNSKPSFVSSCVISLVIFVQFSIAQNRTYYLSNSLGDDARTNIQAQSEATPWKSLLKLDELTLYPGDKILLKSGDTFPGRIQLSNAEGTASAPIQISSYGTGSKPKISGQIMLRGWVNIKGRTWGIKRPQGTSAIFSNEANLQKSHYPLLNNMFVDAQISTNCYHISASVPIGFSGNTTEINANDWSFTQYSVQLVHADTLCLDSIIKFQSYPRQVRFINQSSYLSQEGDWATSTDSIYIQSLERPQNIWASTEGAGISIQKSKFVNLSNMSISGFVKSGILINAKSSHISISYFDINKIEGNGIDVDYGDSVVVLENTIKNTGLFGVRSQSSHSTIRKNRIDSIGLGNQYSLSLGWGGGSGIVSHGSGSIIDSNIIRNTAYTSIGLYGTMLAIRHNDIEDFCRILKDGAGIYIAGASKYSTVSTDGSRIDSNIIVINDTANIQGDVNGIYADEHTRNIGITGNIIVNAPNKGIKLHLTQGIYVLSNLVFNSKNAALAFQEDLSIDNLDSMRGHVILHNQLIQPFGKKAYSIVKKNKLKPIGIIDSNTVMFSNEYSVSGSYADNLIAIQAWNNIGYDLNGFLSGLQWLTRTRKGFNQGRSLLTQWSTWPNQVSMQIASSSDTTTKILNVVIPEQMSGAGCLSSNNFSLELGKQYFISATFNGRIDSLPSLSVRLANDNKRSLGYYRQINKASDTIAFVFTATESTDSGQLSFDFKKASHGDVLVSNVYLAEYRPLDIRIALNKYFADTTFRYPDASYALDGVVLSGQKHVKPFNAMLYVVSPIWQAKDMMIKKPAQQHFY